VTEPDDCLAAKGAPPVLDVEPYTPACQSLLERGEHVLIGVSTGNSYFSKDRLRTLLDWAARHFAFVDVVYTDLYLDTMYLADGDTSERARARAKRAVKEVRRRIHRAVEQLRPAAPLRVRPLSECMLLLSYQIIQRHLDQALATDRRLRAACDDHVRRLMAARNQPLPPDSRAIARHQAGLAYFAAELPLLVNTPEILGVPSSVCCYHTTMPVICELICMPEYWHHAQGHVFVRPRVRELETHDVPEASDRKDERC
jgi:tRNA-dependent cyclodipeptide synthase